MPNTTSHKNAHNKNPDDHQKHFRKGLDDRMRDANGQIRAKRGDTLVSTLREEYGANFAAGYAPDVDLATVLEREGVPSLDQLLKKS